MIQELLYTSAPRGLKPGSRGFCTVLSSQGMAAPLASALEGLSGYRPVFPPGDPQARLNPVSHAHVILPAQGKRYSVLSRVADHGLDYSQRTNKLAHHVVLEPVDRPAGGPAWLLSQPGFLRTDWDGEPRIVPAGRAVPRGDVPPGVCRQWERVVGDAGWAGVLAESFLEDPERLAYLTFSPGLDPLPLIAEAIALLPPEKRWGVTFSTYYTNLPQGVTCNWRCVLADSPEANQSRRHVRALRLHLGEPLGRASGGEFVEAARTGILPKRAASAVSLDELETAPQAPTGNEEPLRLQRPSLPTPPRRMGPADEHAHRRHMTESRPRRRSPIPLIMGTLVMLVLIGTIGFIALHGRTLKPVPENQVATATPAPPAPKQPEREKPPKPREKPRPTEEVDQSEQLPKDPPTAEKPPESSSPNRGHTGGDEQKTAADTPSSSQPMDGNDGQNKNSQSKSQAPPAKPPVTQYIALPTPTNQGTSKENPGKDRTTLIEDLQPLHGIPNVTLYIPPEYATKLKLEAKASPDNQPEEQDYTVKLEVQYNEWDDLATFSLSRADDEQANCNLEFQWMGNDANWDALRWCMLRIRSNDERDSEWRFVLHEESGEETGPKDERMAEWPLPPHKLKVFNDKGPTLRLEELNVKTQWDITFVDARDNVTLRSSNKPQDALKIEHRGAIFEARIKGFQPENKPVSTRVLVEEVNGRAQKLVAFKINEGDIKQAFDEYVDNTLAKLPGTIVSIAESHKHKVLNGWFKNNVQEMIDKMLSGLSGKDGVTSKKVDWAKHFADGISGNNKDKQAEKQKFEKEFDEYVELLENLSADAKTFHDWRDSLKDASVSRIKVIYIVTDGKDELPVTVIDYPR